jgi:hypothetical protein
LEKQYSGESMRVLFNGAIVRKVYKNLGKKDGVKMKFTNFKLKSTFFSSESNCENIIFEWRRVGDSPGKI